MSPEVSILAQRTKNSNLSFSYKIFQKYKCPPNAIVYVSTTNPQIQQRSQISIRRIPPTTSNLALAT